MTKLTDLFWLSMLVIAIGIAYVILEYIVRGIIKLPKIWTKLKGDK